MALTVLEGAAPGNLYTYLGEHHTPRTHEFHGRKNRTEERLRRARRYFDPHPDAYGHGRKLRRTRCLPSRHRIVKVPSDPQGYVLDRSRLR